MDFDILGDTFLKAIYAVSLLSRLPMEMLTKNQIFDQGNTRFGAVKRIDTTTNLGEQSS
jgi:hypothetical protein